MAEDLGIFKSAPVSVVLHLTPLRRVTDIGDLLCIGFFKEKQIEVIFPGRRRVAAKRLEVELDLFLERENEAAVSIRAPMPHPATTRYPLHAEGTWRTRVSETGDDEWEKMYQFIAAKWVIRDQNGHEKTYGDQPISRPVTRPPIF